MMRSERTWCFFIFFITSLLYHQKTLPMLGFSCEHSLNAHTSQIIEKTRDNISKLTDKVDVFNKNIDAGVKTLTTLSDNWRKTNDILKSDPRIQTVVDLVNEVKNGGVEKNILQTWNQAVNVLTMKALGCASISAGLAILYRLTTKQNIAQTTTIKKSTSKLKTYISAMIPSAICATCIISGIIIIIKAPALANAIS